MKKYAFTLSAILLSIAGAKAADAPKVLFTVGKDTTVITEPLREDGRPDYLAALNAQRSKDVTPGNNGFALWLEIIGTEGNILSPSMKDETLRIVQPGTPKLPPLPGFADSLQKSGASVADAEALSTKFTTVSHRPWKRDELPELAAYLDTYDQQLTLLTEAADRPHWYCPLIGKSMIAALLPTLGREREAARALMARATLHADDFSIVVRDITAARKLARHIATGPTIIELLVAAAIEKESCETESAVAAGGTLTVDQIEQLQKADRSLVVMPPMWPQYDQSERLSILEVTMLLALGRSAEVHQMEEPNSRDPFGEVDPATVDWDSVLRQLNQLFDKQIESFKQKGNPALNNADQNIEKIKVAVGSYGPVLQKLPDESRAAFSERVANTVCAVFCAALGRANMIEERSILDGQMMTVVLAAARYKAEKGNWPAKLDDLVPVYIPAIPADVFSRDADHAVVSYVASDAGINVYSVGFNGKDDGGIFDSKMKADDIVLGIPDGRP